MSKETQAKKAEAPQTVTADERVTKLEAQVGYIVRQLEKLFGRDFNSDGKIGSIRISLMSVILALAFIVTALASEKEHVRYVAPNGYDSVITMEADDADDTNDELQIGIKASDNAFYVSIGGTEVLNVSAAGALTSTSLNVGSTNYAGGVTADTEITLIDTDGSATITASAASGAFDGILILDADAGEDDIDTWIIESEAADNDLSFVQHLTEEFKIDSDGDAFITGDLDIKGNGLNTDADLLITPAGGQVHIDGGVDIGGTSAVADNSLKVGNTLAVVGVATFTAESVHNLGLDADYITTDSGAGGGIDTKDAGTLMIGEATADKIEIGITAVETEIQGTLDVLEASGFIGVATFTAKPVLNGGATINEDITVWLNAADEEILIVQTNTAHTEAVPLILIEDHATGATATETDEATLEIDSEGVYALVLSDGALYVEGTTELVGDATLTGDIIVNGTDLTLGATGVKFTSDNDGAVTLLGLSAGSDEDLTINLDDTSNEATVSSSTGVTTFNLSGMELQAKSADFNLEDLTDYIRIDQTNVTGTTAQPLIGVTDARTGEFANTAGEATLMITASGTHALNIAAGITEMQALEVLGSTGNGIDTLTGTALYIGEVTATSVVLGASDITVSTTGPFRMTSTASTLDGTTSLTLDSTHYGQIVTFTNQAAVTVTLPANGAPAGTWIDVMQGPVQNNTTAITVQSAVADTLIGPHDIDLDSVTWGAGSRIGCYARFVSDGGFWQVLNLGGTTMTYTD